jgi:DNA-binding SARP family transcriptional activator
LNSALQKASFIPEVHEQAHNTALIYDLLAYVYGVERRNEEAIDYSLRADAYWQLNSNNGRRTTTLNNLGSLAIDEWRLSDARSALTTGLALVSTIGDKRGETMLRLSLADLELVEGNYAKALAQFELAYAQSLQTHIFSQQRTAIIGAAWAAALYGDPATAQEWLARLASNIELPALLRGRMLLSQLRLTLPWGGSQVNIQPQFTELARLTPLLGPIEQAALLLLEVHAKWYIGQSREIDRVRLHEQLQSFPATILRPLLQPHAQILDHELVELILASLPTTNTANLDHPRWNIHALGQFSFAINNQIIPLSPLHRSIVIRLLDAGPAGLTIERLWEDVWGDRDASMTALHQALRRIRMQTELEVTVNHGHCRIRSTWGQINYDVQQFEQVLAEPPGRDSLQRAVDSYGGEFLLGAIDSSLHWVEARRNYLQQRYLKALEQLARMYETEFPEQAITLYQQVLQVDPHREQTAARLMQLAAQLGNHALVSLTYNQLSEALAAIHSPLLPSTVSLYRHLR